MSARPGREEECMAAHDVLTRIAGNREDVGLVTEAVGGLYTVVTRSGETLRCPARGRIKKEGLRILPGDVVRYTRLGAGDGVVEEVLPRRSELKRPYIANVDQVVLVTALAEPEPNLHLLDRLLVAARVSGLQAFVVWHKADLVPPEVAEAFRSVYARAGFPTVVTSRVREQGREELLKGLNGHITVLAGASGVGKSSLLNWILQEERFATGEISRRLGRGRHTTRAVRLVPLAQGGWVADSPGFSAFDLSGVTKRQLAEAFPEFAGPGAACRFGGCLHRGEPGCGVRDAVGAGDIDLGRYERYLHLLEEIEEFERRQYQ